METKEYLEEVRKEVEGGWTKKYLHRYTPGLGRGYEVCLLGAFLNVHEKCSIDPIEKIELEKKGIKLVVNCIKEKAGVDSIPTFNDMFSTTKEDILEVIDCAINQA